MLILALTFALAQSFQRPQAMSPPPLDFVQRCQRQLLPHLEVTWRAAGYEVDNSLYSRVLNKRSYQHLAGQAMLGMTTMQAQAEISISGPSLLNPASGQECIAPQVSVEFLIPRMNVYVAREFAPATCPYREVLEHELRHVRLYEENLPRLVELIRTQLALRYPGPIFALAGQGLGQLEDEVDQWLRPLIKAELARVEASQRDIDSDDESRRLSSSCMGDVAATLGQR